MNTFEHERYRDNVQRGCEAAPTCAHDASSSSVQEDRHGHGIGDWRDAVAHSEYTNSTMFGETARQLPHVHVTSLTRARLAIAGPQRVCKPSDTCARVVPAVLSCAIITRLRKNGCGSQRLCLPKQCVALNVPNSPKFTRAMISKHMYYINNSLFYISQRLVIHVHKRCNARDVLQNNQQCAIQLE